MEAKRKEVVELENDLCLSCLEQYGGCTYTDNKCPSIKEEAERLFSFGYRKIHKDIVLLSKEEYEKLLKDKTIIVSIDEQLKKEYEYELKRARKETAEKFARDIFNHITTPEVWEKLRTLWLSKDGNFKANEHIYDLLIEPIAKQFGVEIKE